MKKLICSLLLTMACTTKMYMPPNYNIRNNVYTGGDKEVMSAKDIIRSSLDDIVGSNILDKKFTNNLEELHFHTDKMEEGYIYSEYVPKNIIGIRLGNSADYSKTSIIIMKSLASYYWHNHISNNDKKEFRNRIKHFTKAKFLDDNILYPFERFGLTSESYENIQSLLKTSEAYKKVYHNRFDDIFYGEHAFGFLVLRPFKEVLVKLESNKWQFYNPARIGLDTSAFIPDKTDSLPPGIKRYYRGFLSNKILD